MLCVAVLLLVVAPMGCFVGAFDGVACVPAPMGHGVASTWLLTSEPFTNNLLVLRSSGELHSLSLTSGVPYLYEKTKVRRLSWSADAGELVLAGHAFAASEWVVTSQELRLTSLEVHEDYQRVWCVGE